MNRTHLYALAALLAVAGLGLFLYKLLVFGFPVQPEQRTEVWRVEAQIRFQADGGPVKASVFVPSRTEGLVIVDQSFLSPGYGITTEPNRGEGLRAIYAVREARGSQALYYRAVVQPTRTPDDASHDPAPPPPVPELKDAELAAAEAIAASARRQSSDTRTLVALIVKRLQEARPGEESSFLLGPQPSNRRLVRTAVQVIRVAGVPARIITGIALAPERRNAQFTHWLEYHGDGRWRPLQAFAGTRAVQELLPWWRGDRPFVEIAGGSGAEVLLSTSRSYELATRTALNRQRDLEKRLVEFSLFGLPLQAQALFRTILVIPVGILLLVVLRNVVGVKTFGTFMPVLIALAFRQTGLLWGCLFFSVIVGIGLAARFYLERLKLLLVPRLASVVVMVILIIAMLTVISYKLGFDRGLSIGLFPIVILTMTIERMSVVWEERGAGEAFQEGLGSIAVGILCYLVMNLQIVEHLFFVFPELLLLVLAGTLLLGRYSGYRLTEIYRFRVLAK